MNSPLKCHATTNRDEGAHTSGSLTEATVEQKVLKRIEATADADAGTEAAEESDAAVEAEMVADNVRAGSDGRAKSDTDCKPNSAADTNATLSNEPSSSVSLKATPRTLHFREFFNSPGKRNR